MKHALAQQLTLAVAEAVGVDAAAAARGEWRRWVLGRFCLTRVHEVLERELWAFAEDTAQIVRDANGKYAEDPSTYSASFGREEHFHQGLDEYNGRPDGGNIEAQMRPP